VYGRIRQRIYMGFSFNSLVMKPTDEELQILKDNHFLKVKNELSAKIITHLSEIERALHSDLENSTFSFPQGTFVKAGKISKGEQYQGLPYFILDYPRLFKQNEVFSFRTMLWWGHHFSCTLHLSGALLQNNKEKICVHLLEMSDIYFCINDTPWEYHYQENNYLKINQLNKEQLLEQIDKNGFIKLSNYISVDLWNEYKSFTLATFARFLRCVNTI